jgi:hypothetical protein
MSEKSIKNYIPASQGFAEGFLGPKGDKGYFMKVDYKKAVKIINEQLKTDKQVETAKLGLDGDWIENSCVIYEYGKFSKYYCYEGSIWATPILIIFYKNAPSETYECFSMELKKTL